MGTRQEIVSRITKELQSIPIADKKQREFLHAQLKLTSSHNIVSDQLDHSRRTVVMPFTVYFTLNKLLQDNLLQQDLIWTSRLIINHSKVPLRLYDWPKDENLKIYAQHQWIRLLAIHQLDTEPEYFLRYILLTIWKDYVTNIKH